MTNSSKENAPIPKLQLENFTFSPPGPMGWSMSEYEKIVNEGGEIVSTANNRYYPEVNLDGKQLVELGLNNSENGSTIKNHPTETIKSEKSNSQNEDEKNIPQIINENEVGSEYVEIEKSSEKELDVIEEAEAEEEEEVLVQEPVRPKNKVTIIIEEQSLRKPWISSSVRIKE